MKTVCIDARLLSGPGIGTYLKNLLQRLQDAPIRWCALVSDVERFPFKDHIEPIAVSSPIYSIKEQLELPLKIPACDLFWSPHYNIPLLPIRAKKRLVTIHDVFHLAYAHELKLHQQLYAKTVIAKAVKVSAAVITDSQFSKGEIQRHTRVSDEKIEVIPLAADPDLFSPQSSKRSEPPFILFVGSPKPHKNLKGLVAAFKMLKTEVNLIIIGKKEGIKGLENLDLLQGERIQFLHGIPDHQLSHYYRTAELMVFPSFYEGFGLPPLEAMSCGCPVIVSCAGALPEVCGDAVMYVDPHSPMQMAVAIEELMRNEEKKRALSIKGLEQSKRFSWKQAADSHLKLIDRLIA